MCSLPPVPSVYCVYRLGWESLPVIRYFISSYPIHMKESNWPCKLKHAFMFCIHEITIWFLWWIYGLICVAATSVSEGVMVLNIFSTLKLAKFGFGVVSIHTGPDNRRQHKLGLWVDFRCLESLSLLFIYLLSRDVINSLNWTELNWLTPVKGTLCNLTPHPGYTAKRWHEKIKNKFKCW